MNFSQRMGRFLVGIVIGCVLSWYFFSGRGCSGWLPKERILERINSKHIEYTPHAFCKLNCDSINIESAEKILKGGNVNLSKSDTREVIKRYQIEALGDDPKRGYVIIEEADTLVQVVDAGRLEGSANCVCD